MCFFGICSTLCSIQFYFVQFNLTFDVLFNSKVLLFNSIELLFNLGVKRCIGIAFLLVNNNTVVLWLQRLASARVGRVPEHEGVGGTLRSSSSRPLRLLLHTPLHQGTTKQPTNQLITIIHSSPIYLVSSLSYLTINPRSAFPKLKESQILQISPKFLPTLHFLLESYKFVGKSQFLVNTQRYISCNILAEIWQRLCPSLEAF